MFTFLGVMGRRRFLWAAGARIALFAASVAAFPLFMMTLATLTGCQSVGGACGAVGLLGAMAYKPLVFTCLVFSFIGITMRRARDVGMPGWVGLYIPLLIAAGQAFFVGLGAGGAAGHVPRYALLALACTAALGALPSRGPAPSGNPFERLGWIALALGLFVGFHALLAIASSYPAAAPVLMAVGKMSWATAMLVPVAMIALAGVLAWIAWQEHANVLPAPTPPASEPAALSDLTVRVLLALALGLTVITFMVVTGSTWPIVLLTQSTNAVVPTFLMYLAVLSALAFAYRRRTVQAGALLALSLLPFAQWAYAHWTIAREDAREAAEVAAIPTTRLARVPATLVFDSQHVTGMREVWTQPGIERVIAKGPYGARLMQFDRPADRRASTTPRAVAALPDEHLVLKVGRSSSFATGRQNYSTTGGPLELRLVDPQRDELVAVWYRSFNPPPASLPLLTSNGWFRIPNAASSTEIEAGIRTFLDKALKAAG
jgi:uncharacterized membrane protein YhaH (DUF805 family)